MTARVRIFDDSDRNLSDDFSTGIEQAQASRHPFPGKLVEMPMCCTSVHILGETDDVVSITDTAAKKIPDIDSSDRAQAAVPEECPEQIP